MPRYLITLTCPTIQRTAIVISCLVLRNAKEPDEDADVPTEYWEAFTD
jgi:hypothetical protein